MKDMEFLLNSTKEESEKKLRILYSILSEKPIMERAMDPELTENDAERLCMKGDMLFYGSISTNFKPDYKRAMRYYYDADRKSVV